MNEQRRRLEPLRLDRPQVSTGVPLPPGVHSPTINPGGGMPPQVSLGGSPRRRFGLLGASSIIAMTALLIGCVVTWLLMRDTGERHRVAAPLSTVSTSVGADNDGSDPSRPVLPKADEGFVDTRGGWGWGDKCWSNIKAGRWGWAKAECDEGMKMNPASPQPRASLLYNVGLISKAAGNLEGARRAFLASLALREHPEVRAALNSLRPR